MKHDTYHMKRETITLARIKAEVGDQGRETKRILERNGSGVNGG